MDDKLATPSPPSEAKPTNKQTHQNQKTIKSEKLGRNKVSRHPWNKTKNFRERYYHDLKQVKEVTKNLKLFCNVTDMKWLEKFIEGKDRILIVTIDSDYAKRLILLSLGKLKDYINKELNPDEQAFQNAETQRNDNQWYQSK